MHHVRREIVDEALELGGDVLRVGERIEAPVVALASRNGSNEALAALDPGFAGVERARDRDPDVVTVAGEDLVKIANHLAAGTPVAEGLADKQDLHRASPAFAAKSDTERMASTVAWIPLDRSWRGCPPRARRRVVSASDRMISPSRCGLAPNSSGDADPHIAFAVSTNSRTDFALPFPTPN